MSRPFCLTTLQGESVNGAIDGWEIRYACIPGSIPIIMGPFRCSERRSVSERRGVGYLLTDFRVG